MATVRQLKAVSSSVDVRILIIAQAWVSAWFRLFQHKEEPNTRQVLC